MATVTIKNGFIEEVNNKVHDDPVYAQVENWTVKVEPSKKIICHSEQKDYSLHYEISPNGYAILEKTQGTKTTVLRKGFTIPRTSDNVVIADGMLILDSKKSSFRSDSEKTYLNSHNINSVIFTDPNTTYRLFCRELPNGSWMEQSVMTDGKLSDSVYEFDEDAFSTRGNGVFRTDELVNVTGASYVIIVSKGDLPSVTYNILYTLTSPLELKLPNPGRTLKERSLGSWIKNLTGGKKTGILINKDSASVYNVDELSESTLRQLFIKDKYPSDNISSQIPPNTVTDEKTGQMMDEELNGRNFPCHVFILNNGMKLLNFYNWE